MCRLVIAPLMAVAAFLVASSEMLAQGALARGMQQTRAPGGPTGDFWPTSTKPGT